MDTFTEFLDMLISSFDLPKISISVIQFLYFFAVSVIPTLTIVYLLTGCKHAFPMKGNHKGTHLGISSTARNGGTNELFDHNYYPNNLLLEILIMKLL